MKAMYRRQMILARTISTSCGAALSPVGIKLAIPEELGIARGPGFPVDPAVKCWAISNSTDERTKESPDSVLLACSRRRCPIYVPSDSTGRAAGWRGFRLRGLVDWCRGGLSLRCSALAGCNCMVGALSKARASVAVATVLDALDRRVSQHARAFRGCGRRCR